MTITFTIIAFSAIAFMYLTILPLLIIDFRVYFDVIFIEEINKAELHADIGSIISIVHLFIAAKTHFYYRYKVSNFFSLIVIDLRRKIRKISFISARLFVSFFVRAKGSIFSFVWLCNHSFKFGKQGSI